MRKTRGLRIRKKPTVWDRVPIIISVLSAIIAIFGMIFTFSLDKRASDLEAKQLELDVFTITLPYFESYLGNIETATGYCSIIREIASRIPVTDQGARNQIQEMQFAILRADTRILPSGLRPSDLCLLNLIKDDVKLLTDDAHLIIIESEKYRQSQTESPDGFEAIVKDAIRTAQRFNAQAVLAGLGKVEIYDTGLSIIFALRAPLGTEEVVRRIVQHNGLSLEVLNTSRFTKLYFIGDITMCAIDQQKREYPNIVAINYWYYDPSCNPFPKTQSNNNTHSTEAIAQE